MIERGVVRLAGLAAAHGFETRRGTLNGTLPSPALRLRQVHGSEVLLIDPSTELQPFQSTAVADRPCGDALITQRPDVTLAIATADCLPALAFDVATCVARCCRQSSQQPAAALPSDAILVCRAIYFAF